MRILIEANMGHAPFALGGLLHIPESLRDVLESEPPGRARWIRVVRAWLRNRSMVVWVLLGFSVVYLAFFIRPLFLAGARMQMPPTLPMMVPIGADLRETLTAASAWLRQGGSPYSSRVWYPPLTYVLVLPLLWLPGWARYPVHTLATIGAYLLCALWLPWQGLRKRGQFALVMLVFVTGSISYGLQFHLERGQLDLIAALLAYAAIGIYHFAPRRRPWAYLLFTVAIQLKLWPCFLAALLIDNWRDWKGNLRRLLLLGLVNLFLFFGIEPSRSIPEFLASVFGLISHPEMVFIVNHSIQSFTFQLAAHAPLAAYRWVTPYLGWVQGGLVAAVIACVALVVVRLVVVGSTGFCPDLLLTCTLAGLLLPIQSQDYKLVVLAGPVALVLAGLQSRVGLRGAGFLCILATTALSAAYAATLLPTAYKPHQLILQNNLPALLLMLVGVTTLAWLLKPTAETSELGAA